MLTLALFVALGQCTTDTECKGDRICVDGQCVGDAPRVAAPRATIQPTKVQRAAQLGEEIGQRRAVLEDSSIVSPALKLAAGIVILALGIASFSAYQNLMNGGFDCLSACQFDGSLGIPSLVVGPGLMLWGSVQLILSIVRHVTIPDEIHAREEELKALEP